jgi:carbon-monoxide dehydrogenase medium subunit
MIPQPFEYAAPQTLDEALALLQSGEHKILAGGMSLIPLMKLRLANPGQLVDLGRIPGLNYISEGNGVIRVGAMATHHDIETSPAIRARCPLLAETASRIGDVQVRNMGTLGGSIAHADPAADYPAALLALEAKIRIVSAKSNRTVEASDFFQDAFTTAIEPGEIILEVQVPADDSSVGYRYEKVAHPAAGFAVVGVAVRVKQHAGRITMARIGVTGVAPRAFRDRIVERLLESGADINTATAALGEGEEVNSDLYASAAYRRQLARVYAARALNLALTRAS